MELGEHQEQLNQIKKKFLFNFSLSFLHERCNYYLSKRERGEEVILQQDQMSNRSSGGI